MQAIVPPLYMESTKKPPPTVPANGAKSAAIGCHQRPEQQPPFYKLLLQNYDDVVKFEFVMISQLLFSPLPHYFIATANNRYKIVEKSMNWCKVVSTAQGTSYQCCRTMSTE